MARKTKSLIDIYREVREEQKRSFKEEERISAPKGFGDRLSDTLASYAKLSSPQEKLMDAIDLLASGPSKAAAMKVAGSIGLGAAMKKLVSRISKSRILENLAEGPAKGGVSIKGRDTNAIYQAMLKKNPQIMQDYKRVLNIFPESVFEPKRFSRSLREVRVEDDLIPLGQYNHLFNKIDIGFRDNPRFDELVGSGGEVFPSIFEGKVGKYGNINSPAYLPRTFGHEIGHHFQDWLYKELKNPTEITNRQAERIHKALTKRFGGWLPRWRSEEWTSSLEDMMFPGMKWPKRRVRNVALREKGKVKKGWDARYVETPRMKKALKEVIMILNEGRVEKRMFKDVTAPNISEDRFRMWKKHFESLPKEERRALKKKALEVRRGNVSK